MSRASGIGSWPGDDVGTPQRLVRDILTVAPAEAEAGIPYLPELPARGPGADMIGRTAALLAELPVDLQPSGWRMVDRPGRDLARAQAFLRADLDELAEVFDGYAGDLKLAVVGPWTLACEVRLGRGERVLSDPGACRDLVSSLAEGVREHLAAVARRLPAARLILQLDEPSLPAVLAGELRTSSGFGRVRAVEPEVVRRGLAEVLAVAGSAGRVGGADSAGGAGGAAGAGGDGWADSAGGAGGAAGAGGVGSTGGVDRAGPDHARRTPVTVVHCCSRLVPLPLLREAGVGAVSLDVGLLRSSSWESVAATVEAGVALWAGLVPTSDLPEGPATGPGAVHHRLVDPFVRAWRDVGLPAAGLDDVVITPSCGLATLSPADARRTQQVAHDAAGALSQAARG